MKTLTNDFAYQVLLLQAADEGRRDALFGESFERARTATLPFLVGPTCPTIYFEHPLIGEPFLDVTLLYNSLEPKTRIASDLAQGTEGLLEWYSSLPTQTQGVSMGFELDTKDPKPSQAAVHFQPRERTELVRPFFEALGEPERARLYLDLAARMPQGWPLAFFGVFRGRADFPLRVCGYMDPSEAKACAQSPGHLAKRFAEIGFAAFDQAMLEQVCALMAAAPGGIDFQFDVYPDGSLGEVFAIDTQFEIAQPEAVEGAFENGRAGRLMRLLEEWGVADGRWQLGVQAAFARALPVEPEGGGLGRYALTLMPQWAKARWSNAALQPSKLYLLGKAGPIE